MKSALERVGERILRSVVPATEAEAAACGSTPPHHTVHTQNYAYASGNYIYYDVQDCYGAAGCEILYFGSAISLSWGHYC